VSESKDFPIVGSYNSQLGSTIDCERSVNCFEYTDALGKKQKALIGTSGLINTGFVFGAETGAFRAQYVYGTAQFFAVGASLFRISNSTVLSKIGTFNTPAGYVGVDGNSFQVMFVDGVNGYIWDTLANTFAIITDASFPTAPIDVCTLDGFFVVANANTPDFYLSSFNQGMVWGPSANNYTTNFAGINTQVTVGASTLTGGAAGTQNYRTGIPVVVVSSGTLSAPLVAGVTYYTIYTNGTTIKLATTYANAIAGIAIAFTGDGTGTQTITSLGQLQKGSITSHPGNIVACRTLHRKLFLFSSFFTEVWENAGIGTNLPFRRNNSLLMEYGTASIGSVCASFDLLVFQGLDRDGLGAVMMVRGTEAIPISTRALNVVLGRYAVLGQLTDCSGYLIRENGLIFYRMNFTAANHTWVYNVTQSDPSQDETKKWHEEEVLNGNRHPAQTHAFFNGKSYVGSYLGPVLYQVSPVTYTNDGEVIRRMRITRPIVPPGYQRLRIDRLQVDMLQGNAAELDPVSEELDLFTENDLNLLTETGINIALEQSIVIYDPQHLYLFLSISKDGGQVYGYRERAPMGFIGQRTYRTLWRKRGTTVRGQGFVGKFEYFGSAPFVVLGASWCVEQLPE
jgi:hypothetical protein